MIAGWAPEASPAELGLEAARALALPGSVLSEIGEVAPLAILVVGVVAVMAIDAIARAREPGFTRGPALLTIVVALVAALGRVGAPGLDLGGFTLGGFLLVDHLTALCDVVALAALAGIVALAREHGDARRSGARAGFGERDVALLLAGVGALSCVHAGDLLTVWLGVEVMTVAGLLAMLASHDAVAGPSKWAALLRQLVPQAIASAILLLGVALIFAALGTTSLASFSSRVTETFARWAGTLRWTHLFETFGAEVAERDPAMYEQGRGEIVRGLAPAALLLPGLLLTLGGLLAKLGVLPFARRRELAEEAPLHVSALWSTVAAIALISVLIRVYVGGLHSPRLVNEPYGWTATLPGLALLTGLWAAIAAARQRRLTRVVALLGTVQLSLVVLGLVAAANFHGHIGVGGRTIAPDLEILWSKAAGDRALTAALAVLVVSVLASVGAFAAIAASHGFRGPEVRMQHWAGMASRRPALAAAFALCLLALVGLPPLAGFVGKLALLRSLAEHSALRWTVVVVGLELAISAWVALRIIAAMYFGDETVSEPGDREPPGPWPRRVAIVVAAGSVLLGIGGERLIAACRLPAATATFVPGDDDRVEWLERQRAAWAPNQPEARADDDEPIEVVPLPEDPAPMTVEPAP